MTSTAPASTSRAAATGSRHTPPRGLRRRPRHILASVATYAAALVVGAFAVMPLYWMVLTSVKPREEVRTAEPVFWPSELALGRYADVIDRGFFGYLANSLIVALTVTILGVAFSAFAGYALARFDLSVKRYLLLLVLATQMFPMVVLIIPLFTVMRNLDLLDSYTGLIITYLSFSTPLAVWILRGFFQGIPLELEDAALVDGCTRFKALTRIVLPMAGPGLAACSIFVFIAAWNEFIFALTFISQDDMRTLPVALQAFTGRTGIDHGAVMAFSTLFTLPAVVFFLFVHRRLSTGMVSGAVKG